MKPKTKLQQRVVSLSGRELRPTDAQVDYATKKCFSKKAIRNKSGVTCLECGEVFQTNRAKAKCPACNSVVDIQDTLRRTFESQSMFAIVESVEEFQLVRFFTITQCLRKGEKAAYRCEEVVQHWIDPSLTHTVIAKHQTNMGDWQGKMTLRSTKRDRFFKWMTYDIAVDVVCPTVDITPELKRYGFNGNLCGVRVMKFTELLKEHSWCETLLKAKRFDLVRHMYRNDKYWKSIEIALRNNYRIKDASLWIDMLDSLEICGKDLTNAHDVCPKNLKEAHDEWMTRRENLEARRRVQM
ncbi:MAG: PcfJ domain-containing protein [Rikenellaceae bacterium]